MIGFPNEIVLTIFRDALDSPCDPFLFTITSVCRLWRSAAINDPQLWSSILVSSKISLVISELFFNRSENCLIDVTLDLYAHDIADTYIREATQLVASHLPRARTLVAVFHFFSAFDIAAHVFTTVSTPKLQSATFTLVNGHPWTPPDDHHLPILILANAGHLKLQGICLRCAPPLKNLTHLDIYGFCPTRLEFSMLFIHCPLLTTLILRSFGCNFSDESEVSSPIVATSLRDLAISFGFEHDGSSCPCPFTLLSTPKLEYLEICDPSSSLQLLSHFASMFTRHVHHLVLRGVVIDMENAEFYHSFSEISRLDVLKTVGHVGFLTGKQKDGAIMPLSEFPFPHLASVAFDSFAPSRDGLRWLLETAATCVADKGRQFAIELPASSRRELEDMSELVKQFGLGDLLKISDLDAVGFLSTPLAGWDEYEADSLIDEGMDALDVWEDEYWEGYWEDEFDDLDEFDEAEIEELNDRW